VKDRTVITSKLCVYMACILYKDSPSVPWCCWVGNRKGEWGAKCAVASTPSVCSNLCLIYLCKRYRSELRIPMIFVITVIYCNAVKCVLTGSVWNAHFRLRSLSNLQKSKLVKQRLKEMMVVVVVLVVVVIVVVVALAVYDSVCWMQL